MTAVVRTVLGDVEASTLGPIDMHDHLLIGGGRVPAADPDLRLDSIDEAVDEAQAFREIGGGLIVDAMPSGCGRDAAGLAEVSRRARVAVVATAGFHKQEYYGDLHWATRYPEGKLVELLLAECREGIDEFDNAGPLPARTPVRPGLLKVASGFNRISPFEHKALVAVATVQRATGLPLITHADHGTCAPRQLDLLAAERVAPDRVAVSHLDRNPDPGLHAEVAARGAYLIYDGLGRERYRPVSALAAIFVELADAGYAGQLLLGGDVARRSLRRSAGSFGIAGVLTEFAPALRRAGVPAELVEQALVANPARFLSVVPSDLYEGAAHVSTNVP